MARASAKGGGRPRSNARQRQQQVAKKQPVAQKESSRPKRSEQGYESQLFFLKLRRRAKWIFAALAVAFGLGFVVFGVGTGSNSGSLGDVLQDLFGGDEGTAPAVADALDRVDENPSDAEAVLELGRAYLQNGDLREAATTLERYAELEPSDVTSLTLLARVYSGLADLESQRATELLSQGQSFSGIVYTFPGSTGFAGALGQNPIAEAIDFSRQKTASNAGNSVTRWIERQVTVYERLVAAAPDDPVNLYLLGQAATRVNQTDRAIEAFERYLALDPQGDYAETAQDRLDQLTGAVDSVTG